MRSAADDGEYRRNYTAFEYVRALYALDNGWTGQNALVGVVDDGVVETAELSGQLSPLSRDFGRTTTSGKTAERSVIGDAYSDHGTMVAGVIAGKNDGAGIQGIAPDAKIVALRVSDVDVSKDEETLGRTLPAALDYAAANGVKIINASIAKVDASVPSAGWSNMVTRYAAAGGLFVNSAGNDGEENPKGYLDLNASNSKGWLFVAAAQEGAEGLEIADYSNRCGTVAMQRCVTAVGTNATMDVNGDLVLFRGTSSAAGQVSGLAALILSKWPQLSGVEAGEVIVNTARDMGDPGADTVYGRGLIDVEAALSPVAPTLSNGTTQTALAGSVMVIPEALGGEATGMQVRGLLADVTVLDAFGRDYRGDLSSLVARPERQRGLFARRVAASAGSGATRFAVPGTSGSIGYTHMRWGPEAADQRSELTWGEVVTSLGKTLVAATYSGQDGVQDEAMGLAPTSDITLAYAPSAHIAFTAERGVAGGRASLTYAFGNGQGGSARGVLLGWSGAVGRVKVGVLEEEGTLFGAPAGTGALRLGDGARTAFVQLSRTWGLGEWSLDSYASLGVTRLRIGSDTLLTSAASIFTQRAGLSASREAMGGRVRFGLAMPLSAFAGSGTLTYASGYDLDTRSLVYRRERVDLSGRSDPVLSVGYEKVSANAAFRFAAAANTAADDVRALASWRLTLR
ncbi:S8 family peptidase [Novosphingobium sp. M1R2S20]|uniref:S8 family peptidase n=1 Tax=Novosphingobium rhizovicinum TaxID=3228928 RepID=A0ABV3R7C7_9SPHN